MKPEEQKTIQEASVPVYLSWRQVKMIAGVIVITAAIFLSLGYIASQIGDNKEMERLQAHNEYYRTHWAPLDGYARNGDRLVATVWRRLDGTMYMENMKFKDLQKGEKKPS